MRIQYSTNQFSDSENFLSADLKGICDVFIHNDRGEILIHINKTMRDLDNTQRADYFILDATFSPEIKDKAQKILSTMDPYCVEGLGSNEEGGKWKMIVNYGLIDKFFSALKTILTDYAHNSQELEELNKAKNFLLTTLLDKTKYPKWFPTITSERNDLLALYKQQEDNFDSGTKNLITDILSQSITAKTNILLRNAIRKDYHDFESRHATPKLILMAHLKEADASSDMTENILTGRYDNNLLRTPNLNHNFGMFDRPVRNSEVNAPDHSTPIFRP